MRRAITLTLAVALLSSAATAAATASGRVRITEASGNGFPSRSYILTLPRQMHLKRDAVSVTENGREVDGVLVTPVGQTSTQQSGVVLAVDASNSMRGKPILAAMKAAQALASRRNARELVGLVVFNRQATVGLPLTTDAAKIAQRLAQAPRLAYGTHIYEAIDRAVEMLKTSRVKAGSIVLLSDGADTGSAIPEAQAATDARDAHVRIYTVGLKSHHFNAHALKKLARDVGGTYILARGTGALKQIYRSLGATLAHEYLLRYRSFARAGTHVEVRVRVAGIPGATTTAYDTPKLPKPSARPQAPYQTSLWARIWTSPAMTVLVSLLGGALIGLGAYALTSGPRKATIRRRMAEFVTMRSANERGNRPTAEITEKMLEGTQNVLKGTGWWKKFKWELELANIKMPAEQIVVLTAVGSVLALMFVGFALGHTLVGLIFAIAVPLCVRSFVKRELAKTRRRFAEQLPDNLQVLASALRAGHSFVGALSVVANDAPEPARSEFQRAIADEQLGVPIDQALHVIVERMDNRELEQVALVAALQRESGGNTAEVLDRVTDTIRDRFELIRTVRTLTAQGRMSRWVLTLLPLALFSLISLVNPGYMNVLYSSMIGKVLIGFAAAAVTAGSILIKRIVNIKV